MKKTISINIGGVIFHIEEDGYEKLKSYLASIQRYFSSFADSKEIISDIEARVAERFLNKQKAESKQVISLEDVDELIKAMGTVADFEAIERSEDILAEPLSASGGDIADPAPYVQPSQQKSEPKRETTATTSGPRKLYRDLRRKLLGGVAAGLANYFTIDPIWVRLAFLFAVIGLPASSGIFDLNMGDEFGPVSGFVVLTYIAMWVAFPGSMTLEEDSKVKKFYRDPDRKVVGGVAGGVASYFGLDLGVVRFLWVLSVLLFGTGLVIYLVLWVISPNANTLTEKMEMQGEPITLSNIESNIKQNLDPDAKPGEENVLSRIVLLPFRIIGAVMGAVGSLLRGIGPVLRIFFGIILVGIASLSLFGIIVAAAVAFGLTTVEFDNMPVPFMLFREMPGVLVFSGVLLAAAPMAILLLLGLTLLANRRIVGPSVWITVAGLFIVGIIGSTIGGINFQQNFARRGEVTKTKFYSVPQRTLLLDHHNDYDNDFVDLHIVLEGFELQDSLKLETTFSSRGRSREDAERIAGQLAYDVSVSDSTMTFGEAPQSNKLGKFRDQDIHAVLYLPYNKQFAMTRDFYYSTEDWGNNRKYTSRYNLDDVNWKTLRWEMRRDSGLICVNIPAENIRREEEQDNGHNDSYEYDDNSSELNLGERGSFIKQFPVSEFTKIDIGGAYSIVIKQGTDYSVSADGEEADVDDLKVKVENGELVVSRSSKFSLFDGRKWNRVGLIITMPKIEKLDLSGANKARVTGFTGLNTLDVGITGASKAEINVETNQLKLSVTGASKATLKGAAKSAELDLAGACKVEATEMNIQNADVSASGASKVHLGRVANIVKNEIGASKIEVQE